MNDKTYTSIEKQTGGTLKLSHTYPNRPSWKTHGEGRAVVDVTANPGWPTVDLHCVELPEGLRGLKEVYVSLPIEALLDLLKRIGYTVTKPPLKIKEEPVKPRVIQERMLAAMDAFAAHVRECEPCRTVLESFHTEVPQANLLCSVGRGIIVEAAKQRK